MHSSQGDPFCFPHHEQKIYAESNCISESHSLIQKEILSAAEFYIGRKDDDVDRCNL